MNLVMHRIIIFFVLIFSGWHSFAQDKEIHITASAPKVVEMGEYFRLSYVVNGKGSEFVGPKLSNFLFSGPMLSTNMSTQIIGGKVSQTSSYTYNYTVRAQLEGTFIIPAARVTVGGKKYTSNKLKIEVVKGKAQKSQQQQQTKSQQTGNQSGIDAKDLYVRINVDRRNIFKGEQILATIKVYTRVTLARFGDIKIPSYSGFWSQEIKVPEQISLLRENVNGVIYNVGTIKKSILVPQQTGEIIIEPFELECYVNQRNQSRSVFDDFFGSTQTMRKRVYSPKIKIQVKPLPNNAPENFNGAVGSYTLSAKLDKGNVKTNEAVNLSVRINGNGNIKLIKPVKVDFPSDFETYDPKIVDNINVSESGIRGSRTMEYLFIPRFAGDFAIPEVNFVYFDPVSVSYKSLTSQPFTIQVEKGNEEATGTVISGPNREDVRYLGADIRFINTRNLKLVLQKESWLSKSGFYLIYLLIAVLFILIFVLLQGWQRKMSDTAGIRIRKAGRQSQLRLRQAGKCLKENNKENFLNEILKATWGYIGDKLNLDQANLNREFIEMFLASRNVDTEVIESLIKLLDHCEYIRYAPGDNSGELDIIFKDAESVINQLEQELRKSNKKS